MASPQPAPAELPLTQPASTPEGSVAAEQTAVKENENSNPASASVGESLEGSAAPAMSPEASSARFGLPPEPDYDLTPAERLEIRNSNIPLTIGLLLSVIAAFLVFFVSLVGGTAGDDPILPSFWRGLGALAVFTTLSFVASWFMPAPSERRLQLRKLGEEAEWLRDSNHRVEEAELPVSEASAQEGEGKGQHVDMTLADELDEYDEDDDVSDESLAAGPVQSVPQ